MDVGVIILNDIDKVEVGGVPERVRFPYALQWSSEFCFVRSENDKKLKREAGHLQKLFLFQIYIFFQTILHSVQVATQEPVH